MRGLWVVIVPVMVFLYLPIGVVVAYSFNASVVSAEWTGFTLQWYADMVADSRLRDALWVSLRVAFVSCLVSSLIAAVGAVGVHSLSRRIRSSVNVLIYTPLIIPEIILGVALMLIFSVTPLRFGMDTLFVAHTVFAVPYVYIMTSLRLNAVEPSIFEASKDLGAGGVATFFNITLPLVLPGILSGTLLAFAISMDNVMISTFNSGPGAATLPVTIFSMLRSGITPRINALYTVLLIVTAAVVVVYHTGFNRKIRGG